MAETLRATPKTEMPTDLDKAHEWIKRLQEAYHREIRYREQLEHQVSRWRPVVDVAGYWHHARGMHRAPWLSRLRDMVVALEDAEAQEKLEHAKAEAPAAI